MRRWKVFSAAAAVALAVSFNMMAILASDPNGGFPEGVDGMSEVSASGGLPQRFAGVVEPQKTVDIKTGGKKVKELFVKEGEQVKAGQKLFEFDHEETEGKILSAEIELDRLKSSIQSTQKQIETLNKEKQKLANQDSIQETTTRILTLENQQKKNEYEIKKQELSLEQLKNSLNNSTVFSELDGVIKKVNQGMMSGENDNTAVSPGEDGEVFLSIMAVGNYRVKSTVDEKDKLLLSQGTEVTVHSRIDDQTWRGTVSMEEQGQKEQSSGQEDADGRNSSGSKFYVDLESSDGLILGQHVYITLEQEEPADKETQEGMAVQETEPEETETGSQADGGGLPVGRNGGSGAEGYLPSGKRRRIPGGYGTIRFRKINLDESHRMPG